MNPIIKTELLGHIDLSKIIAVRLDVLHPYGADHYCDGILVVDVQLRDKPLKRTVGTFSNSEKCRAQLEPQIEEQILKPWRAWNDQINQGLYCYSRAAEREAGVE